MGNIKQKEFDHVKEAITNRMQLVAYDPTKWTRLIHDACETGLAYIVQQEHDQEVCGRPTPSVKCGCCWKALWCNSRALKPSYRGLPPLYLEAIGHHWALTDAQFYLKGARDPFQAVTDHFALVALTKKELGDLPLKLRDLFLELRGYNYTKQYLAGPGTSSLTR